jgi:multidrug efflux pump subunit AcrB
MMTTITTVVGLLPLNVARDPLFYGMAVVMAFGLIVATVLVTLFLVPILYATFAQHEPPQLGLAGADGARQGPP